MLEFNDLLEKADIDPAKVYLLRHQDRKRMKGGLTCYRLWRERREEFLRYERSQCKTDKRFKKVEVGYYMASFVIDPKGDCLFIRLSQVMGMSTNSKEVEFDYLEIKKPAGYYNVFDLKEDNRLQEYVGRLVIDWGSAPRVWVQRAHRQKEHDRKPIIEIRRAIRDVYWPGYMQVRITDRDINGLAPNWRASLAAANGVYLLSCTKTGEQYVGAAFGAEGFWGRWQDYANGGTGGNKLLKERKKQTDASLQLSILEVFGSSLTEEDAYEAESRWKLSLGSRAFGLNAN